MTPSQHDSKNTCDHELKEDIYKYVRGFFRRSEIIHDDFKFLEFEKSVLVKPVAGTDNKDRKQDIP